MYVWARMARTALTARSRGRYELGEQGRLSFRCLPTDIDPFMHMNNARYMMLADVGRIDLFLRSGLVSLARTNGWMPMLGGLQAVFMREIRLWQRFDLISTIDTWTGSQVLGEHRFILPDGRVAASILTSGGIFDKRNRRFVEMDAVAAALDSSMRPRHLTEIESAFLQTHQAMRETARQEG